MNVTRSEHRDKSEQDIENRDGDKMKSSRIILPFVLFGVWAMTTGEILNSIDSNHNQIPSHIIRYPKSLVDLIGKFFQTYKHIKRITIFLCDNSSTRLSVSIPVSLDLNGNVSNAKVEPTFESKLEHHGNGCLNFQQFVKYLMASENFLIKGDGNIDATMFTTTTTIGNGCNMDIKYEKLDSTEAYSWWDLLKSDNFRQGVVLDLRCRHSQFILQQVNNDLGIQNYFKHFWATATATTTHRFHKHIFSPPTQTSAPFSIDIIITSLINGTIFPLILYLQTMK